MKSGFVVIAVIFLFHGCASTIEVRNDEPLNNDRVFNFNQVNSRIHGHTVKITELGGTTHMATDVMIDQDTTRYAGQQDYQQKIIPTKALRKIEYDDRGSGAITGALLGGLVGAGVSLTAVKIAMKGAEPESGIGFLPIVLISTGAGTVGGLLIGSDVGSTQTFEFPDNIRRHSGTIDTMHVRAIRLQNN